MAQHTQETFKWGNLGCINVEPHNSLITQIATHKNYLVQTKPWVLPEFSLSSPWVLPEFSLSSPWVILARFHIFHKKKN